MPWTRRRVDVSSPAAARAQLTAHTAKEEPKRKGKPALAPAVLRRLAPRRRQGGSAKYSDAVAARILQEMWAGRWLGAICSDPGMPERRTVNMWIEANPVFRGAYTRAREALADKMFEEILSIADDMSRDRTAEGFADHAAVNRARLRVDTRKWLAGKIAPHHYGDKVEHVGEVNLRHLIDRPPEETREQWIERRRRELLPAPHPG